MTVTDGRASLHPDLADLICDISNGTLHTPETPEENRMQIPATPEQITVLCQYTWHDIPFYDSELNGASVSACAVLVDQEGSSWSVFIDAIRPPGDDEWRPAGFSGRKTAGDEPLRAGGAKVQGGRYVLVGGYGLMPDGESIRIELADGSTYEDTTIDGGGIVLAPVTFPPTPHDHATVTYEAPDGTVLASDRIWVGDGGNPPDQHPVGGRSA